MATHVLGQGGKETLRFPLPHRGRLALLNADFRLEPDMQAFEPDDLPALIEYAPDALVLPLGNALALADQKRRGLMDLPSLKSALIVLTSVQLPESASIAPHHRDLLWRAFGLPVFEQLRGLDGRVAARECEVHDGLHFTPDADSAANDGASLLMDLPAGCDAEVVREHCECGAETPRLKIVTAPKVRVAAA